MSILKRIRDILASNIHAKLEQAKDPEIEINHFIRDMERDVREIKAETEAAITIRERTKRMLHECKSEMNKMERYARKALEIGDEDKARRFLEEKVALKPKEKELEKQYELASIKVEQLKLAQDKLTQDLTELSTKRDQLISRLAIAKSKQNSNQIGPSQTNVCLTAFDELEEKANRALAEAEALEELRKGIELDIDRLASIYDKSIEDELKAIKENEKK